MIAVHAVYPCLRFFMPKHGAWRVEKSADEKLIKPSVAIQGCSPSLPDDIYIEPL
jgi:hypothetical protein